jgi:hypothetical protein
MVRCDKEAKIHPELKLVEIEHNRVGLAALAEQCRRWRSKKPA